MTETGIPIHQHFKFKCIHPVTGWVGFSANVLSVLVICKHHQGIILHNEALQRLPALTSRAKYGSRRNKSSLPPPTQFLTNYYQPSLHFTQFSVQPAKRKAHCDQMQLDMTSLDVRHITTVAQKHIRFVRLSQKGHKDASNFT